MGLHMYRGKMSQEAIKGLMAKPEDREPVLKALYEAAGVKLLHTWVLPDWEVITIVDADQMSGAVLGAVIMASGAVTETSGVEIQTYAQLAEAMKRAGAIAAKYRPPGK